MSIQNISANIKANIGGLDSLEYQDNGTERLKGSYPHLIIKTETLVNHLKTTVPLLLQSHKNKKISRICCRYFTIQSDISNLNKEINNVRIGVFMYKVEAVIRLGKIFNDIEEPVYWVWIGATIQTRTVGKTVKKLLIDKLHAAKIKPYTIPSDIYSRYTIKILCKKSKLKKLKEVITPHNVTVEQITVQQAKEIADLYKKRIPVYVAENSNYRYILHTVAESISTTLFAAINNITGKIDAVIANEYTTYPVILPEGNSDTVCVCESNDWVKKNDMPSEVFLDFLKLTLEEAKLHAPDCIETECVPEALPAAFAAGFHYAGMLERTSCMITDGENLEQTDTEIPEYYRKFNSLFLLYLPGGLDKSSQQ